MSSPGSADRRQAVDFGLNRRHDLNCAATGSDHCHSFPFELHVVSPFSAVEGRALEGLKSRERGGGRDRQLAAGGKQNIGLAGAGARLQVPTVVLLFPVRANHLGAGVESISDSVATNDILQVGLDLGLRCVAA